MTQSKLVNFRDLGGLETKLGKQIKPHRLLRTGDLTDISAADKALLKTTYKLKNIIDMRSDKEAVSRPDPTIEGTVAYHFDFFDEATAMNIPSMEEFMHQVMAGFDADTFMLQTYEDIVLTKKGQSGLKAFFKVLLETEEGATLWHCSAGKDRTGVSAALLLYALEIPMETIFADYLKTNDARQEVNKDIIKQMVAAGVPESKTKAIEPLLLVKEDYLNRAFDSIRQNYQNIDNYLETVLLLTPEKKAKLQKNYLK